MNRKDEVQCKSELYKLGYAYKYNLLNHRKFIAEILTAINSYTDWHSIK